MAVNEGNAAEGRRGTGVGLTQKVMCLKLVGSPSVGSFKVVEVGDYPIDLSSGTDAQKMTYLYKEAFKAEDTAAGSTRNHVVGITQDRLPGT